jgi:hypothetical protein
MKALLSIWNLLVAHQLIAAYVLAVMIDQLPAPNPIAGNLFYRWFFGVVQVLAANLNRARLGVKGALSTGQYAGTNVPKN